MYNYQFIFKNGLVSFRYFAIFMIPCSILAISPTSGPNDSLTAFVPVLPKPQPGINKTPVFVRIFSTNFALFVFDLCLKKS